MYHVNPTSGEPGPCRARYDCPFGSEEFHFETVQQARQAFESTQVSLVKLSKTKRVGVFRAGPLRPQEAHFSDLQQLLQDFAATTPPERVGRERALFASPDLQSHSRWILGVPRSNTETHEIMVNPDEVYVYPVELYAIASFSQSQGNVEKFREQAAAYWDAGMTLTQWKQWAAQAHPPSGSWEVLVPYEQNMTVKPVSNRRIIEHSDPRRRSEVNWLLEPRRAAKGLIWGTHEVE